MVGGGCAQRHGPGGVLVRRRQRLVLWLRRAAHVLVREVVLNVCVVWPVYSVTYLAGLVVAAATAGWHDGRGQ